MSRLPRKDFPANNLKEFLDYAKTNDGKVNYGNQGVANTQAISLVGKKATVKGSLLTAQGSGQPVAASHARSS